MDFERLSRIKNPSKQLNFKNLFSSNSSSDVNPWFWTGLIDAEGSFSIIIDKSKTRRRKNGLAGSSQIPNGSS